MDDAELIRIKSFYVVAFLDLHGVRPASIRRKDAMVVFEYVGDEETRALIGDFYREADVPAHKFTKAVIKIRDLMYDLKEGRRDVQSL